MADETHHFWRVARGEEPPPPCAQLTGWRVVEGRPGDGRITVEFDAPASMTNPAGHIQGGFVAALLDDTMGPALATTFEAGEFPATLELKVSLLRPVLPGRVIGRGRVVHRGGSVAFVEGSLEDAEGNVLATGSSTCKLLRREL